MIHKIIKWHQQKDRGLRACFKLEPYKITKTKLYYELIKPLNPEVKGGSIADKSTKYPNRTNQPIQKPILYSQTQNQTRLNESYHLSVHEETTS